MTEVREAVAAADPAEAVGLLRNAWFFGDDDIRRAVGALEIAWARFLTTLDPHVGKRGAPPPAPGAGRA